MYHIFLMYSSVDEQLVWFHLLGTVNRGAINRSERPVDNRWLLPHKWMNITMTRIFPTKVSSASYCSLTYSFSDVCTQMSLLISCFLTLVGTRMISPAVGSTALDFPVYRTERNMPLFFISCPVSGIVSK